LTSFASRDILLFVMPILSKDIEAMENVNIIAISKYNRSKIALKILLSAIFVAVVLFFLLHSSPHVEASQLPGQPHITFASAQSHQQVAIGWAPSIRCCCSGVPNSASGRATSFVVRLYRISGSTLSTVIHESPVLGTNVREHVFSGLNLTHNTWYGARVVARNAAGQTLSSDWMVQTPAAGVPTAIITAPRSTSVTAARSFTITGTATNATRIEILVNNTVVRTETRATNGNLNISHTMSLGSARGRQNIQIRATNTAGTRVLSDTRTITRGDHRPSSSSVVRYHVSSWYPSAGGIINLNFIPIFCPLIPVPQRSIWNTNMQRGITLWNNANINGIRVQSSVSTQPGNNSVHVFAEPDSEALGLIWMLSSGTTMSSFNFFLNSYLILWIVEASSTTPSLPTLTLANVITGVMSHEIGHALGLEDNPPGTTGRNSVMHNEMIWHNIIGPQTIDRDRARMLY